VSALGSHLKALRQSRKRVGKGVGNDAYSLRGTAEIIGVTPGYLSLLENGGTETISDSTLLALAKHLGEDPDVLLIMAGRVSEELMEIISKRPEVFSTLIKQLKDVPDAQITKIVREIRDGEW
jgi:HTH-type transcriptional regulator, competence development regulator